jgi:hypothetical protein
MRCVKMEKTDKKNASRQCVSFSNGSKLLHKHSCISLICNLKSKKSCQKMKIELRESFVKIYAIKKMRSHI